MKSIKCLLLVLTLLLPSVTLLAQDMDVYLLIGQSNMAGRGQLLQKDMHPIDGVWLLTPDGTIEQASNPMNKYSSIRGPLKMQKMSPAYTFGEKIHKETGRKILLVVNAKGGSSIEQWSKGNKKTPYYAESIRRVKEATKFGSLKAIIWHQGERNSENPKDYMSKLKNFVASLRKDLKKEDIPFIAGEIAQWHKNVNKMNPIIQSIPENIPYSDYVSSLGAKPLKDFIDPHFNREGAMLLGKRYADKVLQMVYRKNLKNRSHDE